MDADLKYITENSSVEALKIIRDDYDQRIRLCIYRISSAEEKVKRVDPLSDEFIDTVELIESCLRERQRLVCERLVIHHRITGMEWSD